MNDIVNQQAFPYLSPAQSRLAGLAARPRPLAIGCIVVLAAVGWAACGLTTSTPINAWAALCRPAGSAAWTAADAGAVLGMWSAMTLAMMLPTASPMILTYAEIADTAGRVGVRVVSPAVLIAGYVAVWLGFALVAATTQMLIAFRTSDQALGMPVTLAGAIFLAAGAYQFSSLKHACLNLCQRPFPFFFANWTDKTSGVFKLGLRQGLYCLGCCWALMTVMLAVGAMNLLWMAALGVLMTIEKMTATGRFARALGLALIAAGLALIVSGLS